MVLVYGTICLDRIHLIPSLPSPGGYVEITGQGEYLGGEAANTFCGLRRLGHSAQLAGNPVPDGPLGRRLAGLFADEGVEMKTEVNGQRDIPVCEIFVTPDGLRTMLGYGFAELSRSVTSDARDLAGVDWLTVDPNLYQASLGLVARAKAANCRVYAMDFEPFAFPFQAGDCWQSSTDRFGTANDVDGNCQLVQSLADRSGITAILTDGPSGFAVASPRHPARFLPALQVSPVVDMTGAGDGFRAGVLHGLDSGLALGECLGLGAAVGALNCREVGGVTGLPEKGEVLDLLDQHSDIIARFAELE